MLSVAASSLATCLPVTIPEASLFLHWPTAHAPDVMHCPCIFGRIMKKAKIEGRLLREKDGKGRAIRSLSFHRFRHGAASAAFKGAALKNIARRVTGHAARALVDRYIHIDVEAVKAATTLIPRLPRTSRPPDAGGGEG